MTNPLAAVDSISITIYGPAEPQGSMKAFLPKGWTRPIVTSDNKDLKSYRQEVAKAALEERSKIGFNEVMFIKHSPVAMVVKFYFAKPESVSKKRTAPTVKPDIDKLCRAIFDALSGIVYVDDAQIVDVHAQKFYGLPERAEITVSGKVTETPQSLFVVENEF